MCTYISLISYLAWTSMNSANLAIFRLSIQLSIPTVLRTNWVDVYATFTILWYTSNIYVKALPSPLWCGTVFMSVKDITWLLNSFRSSWRPWKNFVYHKLVHKIFPRVLAHCLLYYLLGRHKMTPKLSRILPFQLFGSFGLIFFQIFHSMDSDTFWSFWIRADALPRRGGRQK